MEFVDKVLIKVKLLI